MTALEPDPNELRILAFEFYCNQIEFYKRRRRKREDDE